MLASISPFGERARAQRWALTATAFIVASTLAGTALGAALGSLGALGALVAKTTLSHHPVALALLACFAVAGLVFDARVGGVRVPGPARQVNENWLTTYRGWVYGAGFGAQLGAAFTTIVPSSITYVAFACCTLSGSIAAGCLIGATFGAARALPILLTRHAHDPGALRALLSRVDEAFPRARSLVVVSQSAALVLALVALVHSAAA
ncbi:MAG: hypothetical protein JWL83_2804 [Actinomycetia bacterium]|nr:hypothetical protein [Actinomycetes bacterium]